MATYLVCETFKDSETIYWGEDIYTLGTDAFTDIVTAELVASQDSPDDKNEIIVFAGNYPSSLNNFQNYEGITLNVTGVKYHDDDVADKATVTFKNFNNNGIATFANAAFEATSVINNAGKTITLNGATFEATTVTNDGTFTIKGGATVNSNFISTSSEKPGTIRLAGTINSNSEILGDNTISIASATTLDGATVEGGILDVKNNLTLKAATLTADTASITSGKYIIVDAGISIINLDEVNFTGATGITMKEGAILTDSNIAGTVSVHTSATGDGATITGENTIEAILVPNKATAVKLNLLEAELTSDITVNGNGIVNALGDNAVTGDITNNGVINVADGNSLELNVGGLANAGTINLTGSITTTTTAQIANSGNIIVTGTGDLAAAVVMGDNGKVVFGTVDAAADTTFNGSISDIYNNPNPATYGNSTVQVLNGEVEFAKDSVVDIQGDAADNRFTVGFRDAAIDPATVAATATVKGTVASHNGTWIGAAKAYDESFFDKKFVLIVDGGSYTNDANAFTVRSNGEVIVRNEGSLSITDAAIRSDITVTDSSMTFGSGNLYGEEGYTATIAITDSALTVNNDVQIGNSENADRKGALVLDNATVDGTGKLNVTLAGSVSADDTNIDVAEVANAGSFTVSGDSSVSIGKLSGAIILDDADLTDSTIGTTATSTSAIKNVSGNSTIEASEINVAGFIVGSNVTDDAEAIGNASVTLAGTILNVTGKTQRGNSLFVGDWTTAELSDKTLALEVTDGSQVTAAMTTVYDGGSLLVSGEGTKMVTKDNYFNSDVTVTDGAELSVQIGSHWNTLVSDGAKLSTMLLNGEQRRIRVYEGGTITVDNASIELDTANQTSGGQVKLQAIGSLILQNGSTLTMGHITDDTAWSKDVATHDITVGAKGSITVTGSTFDAANETVTNNGSFTVSGTSTLKIGTLTGNAIEVAAGSTIKDSTVGGNLSWEEGTVTFKGENSISRFADYDKVVIGKGDSLTLTGSRPTLGYGREINVTGDIEGKATETDKTTVTKSFETMNGFSLYGTGTGTLNVTNAYFVSGGNGITLKPKNEEKGEPGSLGTYTLTFTNSIADIKYLKLYETGNEITATVTFDASVLNHDNNITNEDPGSTMTFKNGSVANATGSFKNGGVFQVLSGSKFTANSVIQYGENSGNDGAITVDGEGSVMTLVNSVIGHAFKSVEGASITVTNGGVFSANYVTNEGTITIDAASLLTGTNLDNTNGTITIEAKDLAEGTYAKVIDLSQASALTNVTLDGDADARLIFGADGDVTVTNISSETLYVDSTWAGEYSIGEEIVLAPGSTVYYGINAFSDIATMVSGITSVTNKIKFLEGGTYDLGWKAATISQSMTFETDGVMPTIWNGEFNLGTKNGTGDTETYELNSDIYFFQFATNKNSPAVLTIDAELSIAQGIWFKAGTKTTVTEDGSIQRIDQYPWEGKPAELQAGQFEVYGELTVNGTVNYFTQGATSYTFRIGNANEETYTGVLNVDGGNVHFMNNTHVDGNHPAYAPSLIDENGTVNLTNGGKLTVDHPLTNKGTITIDAMSGSLLTGTTLTNTGTITIDATNLAAGSYVKVIDLNQTSALTGVTLDGDGRLVCDSTGDVWVTNITANKLYVNNAWAGSEFGEEIVIAPGTTVYYGIDAFDTLAGASDAAAPGKEISISIAGNLSSGATFGNGQNVEISGTALIDWNAFFFVGRGRKQVDPTVVTTVTFKNANITSTKGTPSGNFSTGFNVSGYNKNSTSKGYGVLEITDSSLVCDYVLDRNLIDISNSNVTFGNLWVHGMIPAETGTEDYSTATLNLSNDSKLTLMTINGMPLGAFGTADDDGYGVINISDSTFDIADTSAWTISELGTLNLNGNATFTAAGAVINKGAINMEVLPKAETEVLTETESTETEEEVPTETLTGGAFNKFTAKSINNTGVIEAYAGSTITTETGYFKNATGGEVTVEGDAEDIAGTVIEAKKGIANTGTFSITNATVNVDGQEFYNSTGGVLSIAKSIVTVKNGFALASYAGTTTVTDSTINGPIRVDGGVFTIGAGTSTLNGILSGTNGKVYLADGAILKDSKVERYSDTNGKFVVSTGATVGLSGANTFSVGITNGGTITIDATSSVSAASILGGTIELTNFADNATRPVITVNSATDFTATVKWTYKDKEYTLDGATTYTDDKKFLVQKSVTGTSTTISVVNVSSGLETLVVNDDWKSKSAGDVVTVDKKDYVIGYNAFANVDGVFALYADKAHRNTVTKEVKFLSSVTAEATGGKTFFFSDTDIAFTAASDVTVDLSKYGRVYLMGYYTFTNWTANLPKDEEGKVVLPTFTVGKGVTIVTSNALAAGQTIDQEDVDPDTGNADPNRDPGASNILVNGTLSCYQVQSVPYSTVTTGETGVITTPGSGDGMIVRSSSQIVVNGDGKFETVQFSPNYVSVQGGTLLLNNVLGKTGALFMSNRSDDVQKPDGEYVYATDSEFLLNNSKLYSNVGFTFPVEGGRSKNVTLKLSNGSVLAGYSGDTVDLALNGTNGGNIFIESVSQLIGGTVTNTETGIITVTTGGLFSATALTNAGAITVGGEDVAAVGEEGDDDYKPAVAGAGSLTADTITNSGSIDVTNGSTLTATDVITNNGDFSATGSTVLAKKGGFGFVNAGTLTIDSSSVTVGGGAAILKNEGAKITIQNQSTVKAGLWNSASGIVTITDSTVGTTNAYVKNIGGKVEATNVVLKASSFENSGSYVIGGESTFTIKNLNAGSITLADDAEISASTITESAEGTSVKVLADTEVTFVGTNSINAVIDNAGTLSADDLQVTKLINGIAATESTESVKGTITAATLTAVSIENNNGAGTNIGSSIELTGNLSAGDITNGVEAIADEAAENAEPDNKAFITAANITAGSIKNYGTIGSQNPAKTSIDEITLTGALNNGKYGNVFATTLTADSIENDGEIVVNEIHAGSINNKASGENKPCGVIAVDTGSIVIEADEIINSGYIKTNEEGSITAGAITNNAYNANTNDGLIWTNSITANGTVINYGKIDVDDTLTANRVENKGGEFTVDGESVIAGNVVVSGGEVTFNGNVTAANLNAQNASATININNATVSVSEKVYYYGTIVATNSVLDGIEFIDGSGTLKVVHSTIDGIKLNGGTMQIDTMSLEDVTLDGSINVVGDSDFAGINEMLNLTVSEGATLTINAAATVELLSVPSLVINGALVNSGDIVIDAAELDWGSTLKSLKIVEITDGTATSTGTLTVENMAEGNHAMAVITNEGIFLYKVNGDVTTDTLYVNNAWTPEAGYTDGYEFTWGDADLMIGVNAFADTNKIVYSADTEKLVFVGSPTAYGDLTWNGDEVQIDGTAKFGAVSLANPELVISGSVNATSFTVTDATVTGAVDVGTLNLGGELVFDGDLDSDTTVLTDGEIDGTGKAVDLGALSGTGTLTTSVGSDMSFTAALESDIDVYINVEALTNSGTPVSFAMKGLAEDAYIASGEYASGPITKYFKVTDTGLVQVKDANAHMSCYEIEADGSNYGTALDYTWSVGDDVYYADNVIIDGANASGTMYLKGNSADQNITLTGNYGVAVYGGKYIDNTAPSTGRIGKSLGGDINIAVEDGTFSKVLVGGDRINVTGVTSGFANYYRENDDETAATISLTINGGTFNNYVAAGMIYQGEYVQGCAEIGNTLLTITDGTFNGKGVFGGNFAATKSASGRTLITGTSGVKIVAGEGDIILNTGLYVGSYGAGAVSSTNLTFTGDQGDSVLHFKQIWGGCSSDSIKKAENELGNGTYDGSVSGKRTLSFTAFEGSIDCTSISGFSDVTVIDSTVTLNSGLAVVQNWTFDVDSTIIGSFTNDFKNDNFVFGEAGDEVGFESWNVFEGIGEIKAWDYKDHKDTQGKTVVDSGFASVKLFGETATWTTIGTGDDAYNAYVATIGEDQFALSKSDDAITVAKLA